MHFKWTFPTIDSDTLGRVIASFVYVLDCLFVCSFVCSSIFLSFDVLRFRRFDWINIAKQSNKQILDMSNRWLVGKGWTFISSISYLIAYSNLLIWFLFISSHWTYLFIAIVFVYSSLFYWIDFIKMSASISCYYQVNFVRNGKIIVPKRYQKQMHTSNQLQQKCTKTDSQSK